MSDHSHHDELCPYSRWPKYSMVFCQCALIREVISRERERIAAAIEARRDDRATAEWLTPDDIVLQGYVVAARIARRGGNGGSADDGTG